MFKGEKLGQSSENQNDWNSYWLSISMTIAPGCTNLLFTPFSSSNQRLVRLVEIFSVYWLLEVVVKICPPPVSSTTLALTG